MNLEGFVSENILQLIVKFACPALLTMTVLLGNVVETTVFITVMITIKKKFYN